MCNFLCLFKFQDFLKFTYWISSENFHTFDNISVAGTLINGILHSNLKTSSLFFRHGKILNKYYSNRLFNFREEKLNKKTLVLRSMFLFSLMTEYLLQTRIQHICLWYLWSHPTVDTDMPQYLDIILSDFWQLYFIFMTVGPVRDQPVFILI